MAKYRYETHLHTSPASACAKATVEESVRFYKRLGYDGIFITNHFLDANINKSYRTLPYEEQIELFFQDAEEAEAIGREVGIKVFAGVELSGGGADFLVYGLDKEWYLSHPEIMSMKKCEELPFLIENGALVIQAHPYRNLLDHISLFPRHVHGAEVINASMDELTNAMAKHYAKSYSLISFAGSDNHTAGARAALAGVELDSPISSVKEFTERILALDFEIFTLDNPLLEKE